MLFLVSDLNSVWLPHTAGSEQGILIKTQTNAIWQNTRPSCLLRTQLTSKENMELAVKEKIESRMAGLVWGEEGGEQGELF